MKITLTIADVVLDAELPYPHADHVTADMFCPSCKAAAPLKVSGKGNHIESHDTYAARAVALCCRKEIGTIRATMSTIFGVEEDERVLNGRARVY